MKIPRLKLISKKVLSFHILKNRYKLSVIDEYDFRDDKYSVGLLYSE